MHLRIAAAALAATLISCGPSLAGPAQFHGPAPGAEAARPQPRPTDLAPTPARFHPQTGVRLRSLAEVRPVPRPAAVPAAGLTAAWLGAQPMAVGGPQWRCLAEALYFEARGQRVAGQIAVAEVIVNRVESDAFPSSVCAVVNQGTGHKWRCQFTYTCDGEPEVIRDRAAWGQVGKVARVVLDGDAPDLTGGALYYHAQSVDPRWNDGMTETASIGAHRFFSPPAGRPLG